MKSKINISSPYIDDKCLKDVERTIKSGWHTHGPVTERFENEFAKYHNAKFAVAVSSATAGLHLSLLSFKFKPGSEVIVPAFSWITSANSILYNNLKTVFVDVEKESFNVDIDRILKTITKNTVAVLIVNLFGLMVDTKNLRKKLPKHIKLIEDSACASGSMRDGYYSGSHSDFAIFSFHPRKLISTGEGGMILTNNKRLYKKIKELKDHGASFSSLQKLKKGNSYMPNFNCLGFNYRYTDIQAAVGFSQLKKLKIFINQRNKWAAIYNRNLKQYKDIFIPYLNNDNLLNSFQSYVFKVKNKKIRNQLIEYLSMSNIQSRPGTHSIPQLNYYKKIFGFKKNDFPNAFEWENNSIAIPLHNCMKKDDYNFVIRKLNIFFTKFL
ncbi:MAG: perosamine synthetase [Rickettsiales bacterium]|nr:perosamine synthetase [Rickettsiales bacterium]